jgi:hypothetical protein
MADECAVTVANIVEALGLTVAADGARLGTLITGALVSDLLSYVMAGGKPGQVWVTIQTHSNIVAVAALAGLSAIIIAAGCDPGEETIARAEDEGITLLTSTEPAFTLAGRLYALGVR